MIDTYYVSIKMSAIESDGDIYLVKSSINEATIAKIYDSQVFGKVEDYCFFTQFRLNLVIVNSIKGIHFGIFANVDNIKWNSVAPIEGKRVIGLNTLDSADIADDKPSPMAIIFYSDGNILMMNYDGLECKCRMLSIDESRLYVNALQGLIIFNNSNDMIFSVKDNNVSSIKI